jgi:hypothetical protein
VRVTLKTAGGLAYFPGVAKPIVVDSDVLAPEDAEHLRELVEAASFFDLPVQVGARTPGSADMRTRTLTVEDGTRRHVVSAEEPHMPATLKHLIDFVTTRGKGHQ